MISKSTRAGHSYLYPVRELLAYGRANLVPADRISILERLLLRALDVADKSEAA